MRSSAPQDQWNGYLYTKQTFSKLQRHFGKRVIDQVITAREADKKGQLVGLDIGCGDGFLTADLSQQLSCRIHGIDSSQSMVDNANHWRAENPNLMFSKQNIADDSLSFPEKYSLVVSFFCLHWVLKQEQAYANIAKALDENGHAYLLVSAQKQVQSNKKSYIAIIRELIRTEPYNRYFSDFRIERANLNKDNLPVYIKNAGLNVVEIVEINEAYLYENKDELSRFFQGIISGYLALKDGIAISEDERLELTAKLCNHLVNELVAQQSYKQFDDGKLESQQSLLLAIIEKPAKNLMSISPEILLHASDDHKIEAVTAPACNK